MKKGFLALLFIISFLSIDAQIVERDENNNLFRSDSTTFRDEILVALDGTTTYTDYRAFNIYGDTTVIDTTLTLAKDFKFNYIRKDDFELLSFNNQGQTYNRLGYDFGGATMFPEMGITAKTYNYVPVDEIPFYYVPTPTSELMYRTGLEQGQVLDAFITMNTSPQLNVSIGYKGLRSLGKYRYALSSHGNFRTNFNYNNKKKTYYLKGQFYSFDFLNNENGGLTDESIINFESNDPNYTDRARLDVRYTDAENVFDGKRYYLEQKLAVYSKKNAGLRKEKAVLELEQLMNSLFQTKNLKTKDSIIKLDSISRLDPNFKMDSLTDQILDSIVRSINGPGPVKKQIPTPDLISTDSISIASDSLSIIIPEKIPVFAFSIGHILKYETKHYRFKQGSVNEIFGEAFGEVISDHTSYQNMSNEIYAELNSSALGRIRARGSQLEYNYHYNSILYYQDRTIPDRLKGSAIAVGADWKKQLGKLHLSFDANSIISGDLTGDAIKAKIKFKKDSVYSITGFGSMVSKTPSFNKLLFQSDYKHYNWHNDFQNEEITTLGAEIKIDKWGSLEASYNTIDNHTYFDSISKPVQASESLNYLKVKAKLGYSYRKFTLENTVMYQKVEKGDSFFRVPELVARSTLYFSSHLFKGDPLYLQTGVTVKYFTPFQLGAYDPLLSEFVLQDNDEIGGYPILDFFINLQIQRTRIFLKAENFAGEFTGRNYYSAPRYPYRDFIVRFGLVWNFFI